MSYMYLQHYAQTQQFLRAQFLHLVVFDDLLVTTLVSNEAELLEHQFYVLLCARTDIGLIHYNVLVNPEP